ncbi:putative membrane protein [Hyella patelloides LEGE 07179]|uniref:Putative membrane protein n=1 Tax=Hyella patelloides LEGE 07179 TaxID=945734 RepID=A0A563W4C4_9CYAN|nr:YihY/virulence factor BrkB family protein [Hyella patelloides]VEP18516.1 putative membrane protein [Hyella patelloides LEGE 07179]
MLDFIRFLGYLNWQIVRKTIAQTISKRLSGLSAEMAFNAMLGFFPAIITVLTAISLFENSVATTLGDLAIRFADIIPKQVWNLLINFTEEVKVSQGKSWFSLSFIAAIWIISGVIGSAINAIDNINQVPSTKRRPFWKNKIIAILLTIGTIFLLITACFLLIIGDLLLRIALQQNWGQLLLLTWKIFSIITIFAIVIITLSTIYQIQQQRKKQQNSEEKNIVITIIIGVGIIFVQLVYSIFIFVQSLIVNFNVEQTLSTFLVSIWRLLSFPMGLGIVAFAFAFIYYFGCSCRPPRTPLMPGAILAAIFWAIVSAAFRYYVSHVGVYNKVYGALGTAIVLLLWLYLSSLVMLLGEQLNVTVGKEIAENKNQERLESK